MVHKRNVIDDALLVGSPVDMKRKKLKEHKDREKTGVFGNFVMGVPINIAQLSASLL